ncbi:hypothetical protein vBVpaMR16F_135 [Vibrio phage vB_VpaM_R16F]|nr:hypothetical protein vBVpaMR16F_135 [Vibrio phage vB_VpaM_R16F]
MQHKFFPNRFQLWKYLEPKCKGLDFNRTLRLPMCSFSVDGEDFISHDSKSFLVKLNDKFGLDYDVVRSQRRGQKFTLIWWESDETKPEDKKEDLTKEVVEDVSDDTAEEVLDEEVEASEESSSEVDWEWVNSLENKKYDKEKLDKYAEEKFSISLNRRNTLENMIVDFKDQLKLS